MSYPKFRIELFKILKKSVENVKDKNEITPLLEITADEYMRNIDYVVYNGVKYTKDQLVGDVKECINTVSIQKLESLDKTKEFVGSTIGLYKWFASGGKDMATIIRIEFYKLSSCRVLMIPVSGRNLERIRSLGSEIISEREYERIESAETDVQKAEFAFDYFHGIYSDEK